MASPVPLEVSAPLAALRPLFPGSAEDYARYKALIARTVDVFGDEIKASKWLSTPSPDLNGQTPIELVQKHGYNVQILEPIFIGMEHGIDY